MKTKTKTKTETKLPAALHSFLEDELNRNLLLYSAGRVMFCPGCQHLLDARTTVVCSIHGVSVGQEVEQVVSTQVVCAKCWDKFQEHTLADVAALASRRPQLKIRSETVDGRTVFKKD